MHFELERRLIDERESLGVVMADLHVHTCLSPCAGLDMTPMNIVKKARERGLSLIAVTDHNSAENAAAVMAAAHGSDLRVLPGMEVTTAEEAHVVALFETLDSAAALQHVVFDNLTPGKKNDENLFGMQVIANEFDEVAGFNEHLLIGATTLDLGEVVDAIHRFGGLAVAAHIDREGFSVIGQLGFIPDGMDFDALEISKALSLAQGRARFREYERFPFVTSSDAHKLDEIGTVSTRFRAARPEMDEIRLALAGERGREIITAAEDC